MMINNPFPAAYAIEFLQELLPFHSRRLFYPGASTAGGRDGVNVRVIPNEGAEWIGTFASGRFGSKTVTGIWTTPNRHKICVLSEGQSYIVDSLSPEQYELLPIVPIIAVRSSLKYRLLLFANYTEVLAFGSSGITWRTKRLAWDGLEITSMNDDQLCGSFWDIGSESEQFFVIDLATGQHTGGAEAQV